jgi:hypothetical protein
MASTRLILSCAALRMVGVLGVAEPTCAGGQQPAAAGAARPELLTVSKFISHESVGGCTAAGSRQGTQALAG